jgi:transcriptional regulator with XRE-family HTH domain
MDKYIEKETGLIADRLDAYIKYKGLSRRAFAERIGVIQQALNRQIKERKGFSSKTIIGIAQAYKELNLNWLIRGEGDMIIGVDKKPYKLKLAESAQYRKEFESSYAKKIEAYENEIQRQRNIIDALTGALRTK